MSTSISPSSCGARRPSTVQWPSPSEARTVSARAGERVRGDPRLAGAPALVVGDVVADRVGPAVLHGRGVAAKPAGFGVHDLEAVDGVDEAPRGERREIREAAHAEAA
jgi:hypothetical protein